MSYDVKYIGMDVHQEAIVIAILNESGKLVMESVIETKAGSILQFLHGLRAELHVTWEEGTWGRLAVRSAAAAGAAHCGVQSARDVKIKQKIRLLSRLNSRRCPLRTAGNKVGAQTGLRVIATQRT